MLETCLKIYLCILKQWSKWTPYMGLFSQVNPLVLVILDSKRGLGRYSWVIKISLLSLSFLNILIMVKETYNTFQICNFHLEQHNGKEHCLPVIELGEKKQKTKQKGNKITKKVT